MTQIMYCFRNRVEKSKQSLQEQMKQVDIELEFVPAFCMRLCFLCPHQYVCSVNGELIVGKDQSIFNEHVKTKIIEKNV